MVSRRLRIAGVLAGKEVHGRNPYSLRGRCICIFSEDVLLLWNDDIQTAYSPDPKDFSKISQLFGTCKTFTICGPLCGGYSLKKTHPRLSAVMVMGGWHSLDPQNVSPPRHRSRLSRHRNLACRRSDSQPFVEVPRPRFWFRNLINLLANLIVGAFPGPGSLFPARCPSSGYPPPMTHSMAPPGGFDSEIFPCFP